ncbi:hypothetical protein Btru_038750 [Bulinus truncatus]|nr:hypothetical protein Btru_038750 [Bulinus truncatus]
MVNLLIALFTNAINENESQREQILRFQRFQLTNQYSESRLLLPPFSFLFFRLRSKVGNPFLSKIPVDIAAGGYFERSAALKIIQKAIDMSLRDNSSDLDSKASVNVVGDHPEDKNDDDDDENESSSSSEDD